MRLAVARTMTVEMMQRTAEAAMGCAAWLVMVAGHCGEARAADDTSGGNARRNSSDGGTSH